MVIIFIKKIQKERFVHMIHIYNTHIHIIVIVTILSSCFINVLSIVLSFLFDLLFRREALRQHRNGFLIILFLGDIERCRVGIGSITVRLDCAIAAKVD